MMQFSEIASIQNLNFGGRNRTRIVLIDNTLLSVRNCNICRFRRFLPSMRRVPEMSLPSGEFPASDGQQVNGD